MHPHRPEYANHLRELLQVVEREAEDFLTLVNSDWREYLQQLRDRVEAASEMLATNSSKAAAKAVFREVESGLLNTLTQMGAESVRPCPQIIHVHIVVDPVPSTN